MSKKIIAFAGMPGSGKGTCVEFFTKQDLPSIYFGGMVYEEVERRGLDRVKDEIEVRNDMRAKEGPAVLAKRAAARADELFEKGSDLVILDGLYSWEEYLYLSSKYGDDLHLCAVIADRETRYERIMTRDDGRVYPREQIIKREYDEIEQLNKGGPIAEADHYLFNNGSLEELTTQLEQLQAKLTA